MASSATRLIGEIVQARIARSDRPIRRRGSALFFQLIIIRPIEPKTFQPINRDPRLDAKGSEPTAQRTKRICLLKPIWRHGYIIALGKLFRKYWDRNITVGSFVTESSFVLAGIIRAPVLGLPIAVCNYSEAVALLSAWAQNSSAAHLVAAANTHLCNHRAR